MRLFIGIELPSLLKERIIQATAQLHQVAIGKWVEQHNLHITLGFIGQVPENLLPKISAALNKAVQGRTSFELGLNNVVALPTHSPKLLALTTTMPKQYVALREAIIKNLMVNNVILSVHNPHITLVRLKRPLRQPVPKLTLKLKLPVRSISLIQSALTPKGPIYKPLQALKLTAERPLGRLRPNIAICVINPKNEVLLVKHRDHVKGYWQFPQGGVGSETAIEAVKRELAEELGLTDFELIGLWPNVYHYLWPKKLRLKGRDPEKRNYVGQEQSLAIIRVKQLRPKLKPDPREAASVRWFPVDKILTALNPIRRQIGRLAVVELKKIINSRN